MHLITTRIHLVSIDKSFDQTTRLKKLCIRNLTIMPDRGHYIELNLDNNVRKFVVCKIIWTLGEIETSVDMEVYDPAETASFGVYGG